MAGERITTINRPELVTTPFRTLPINRHRERRISITEGPSGKAVRLDVFTVEGRQLGGTLHLFPREIPGFMAAMTEAAAAIGVEIPAHPAPEIAP